jgi:Transglutaminase-like superfamily
MAGVPADHVIGVRRFPFQAHAWVECGGVRLAAFRSMLYRVGEDVTRMERFFLRLRFRPPPLLRLPSTFHNGAYASLGVPAQIQPVAYPLRFKSGLGKLTRSRKSGLYRRLRRSAPPWR